MVKPTFLDVRHMQCPLPLLKTKQALQGLSDGEHLAVVVTDPTSLQDFKAWTDLTLHSLLKVEHIDGDIHYLICKNT